MKMVSVRFLPKVMLGASLLVAVSVQAQDSERPVKMTSLPPAVRQTVEAQSQGGVRRGLSKETKAGVTFYEVELKVNGHNKDVLIDSTGAVVEVEEEIALAALSPVVKAGIEKQAGKGRILMVESITKNGALAAYEAHIKTGRRITEVKVGTDGEIVKD